MGGGAQRSPTGLSEGWTLGQRCVGGALAGVCAESRESIPGRGAASVKPRVGLAAVGVKESREAREGRGRGRTGCRSRPWPMGTITPWDDRSPFYCQSALVWTVHEIFAQSMGHEKDLDFWCG